MDIKIKSKEIAEIFNWYSEIPYNRCIRDADKILSEKLLIYTQVDEPYTKTKLIFKGYFKFYNICEHLATETECDGRFILIYTNFNIENLIPLKWCYESDLLNILEITEYNHKYDDELLSILKEELNKEM